MVIPCLRVCCSPVPDVLRLLQPGQVEGTKQKYMREVESLRREAGDLHAQVRRLQWLFSCCTHNQGQGRGASFNRQVEQAL